MSDDFYDELDRIAQGTTKKQATLVNLTFRLDSARFTTHAFEDKETGEKATREQYVATVSVGDQPAEEYYLGGAIIMSQVKYLIDNDKLPAILKMIRDTNKTGSPYMLVRP